MGPAADCGGNSLELLAKYDPVACSWKTAQCLLFEDSTESLGAFPRWGLMRNGALYRRPMPFILEHLRAIIARRLTTCGSESGSVQRAPTPRAQEPGKTSVEYSISLTDFVKGVSATDRLMARRVPTPKKSDAENGGRGDLLQLVRGNRNKHFVRMPTPKVATGDYCYDRGDHDKPRLNLSGAVKFIEELRAVNRLNTPTAQDAKCNGSASQVGRDSLNAQVGGSLNPDWVEWLMGWPIGWTGLRPLATGRFLTWWCCRAAFSKGGGDAGKR